MIVEGKTVVEEGGRQLYAAAPREVLGMLETLARVQGGVEARADVETVTLDIRAPALPSILEDRHEMARDTIQTLARRLLADPTCSCLPGTWDRELFLPQISAEPLDLVDRIQVTQGNGVFAHARVDSLAEIASQFEEFHAPPERDSGARRTPAAGSSSCSTARSRALRATACAFRRRRG